MRDDLTIPMKVLSARPTKTGLTLTARAVLTGCLVALISVIVTAALSIPLAAKAAERSARESLAEQADVIAIILRSRADRTKLTERLLTQMRRHDVDVFLISNGAADRPGLPDRLVETASTGPLVGRTVPVNGVLSMVEGRPIGDGDAVIVTQPAGTGLRMRVLRGLWLPLLAGLAAGVLAGVLLGRMLARPIRNAATAAARLSSGDRKVRLAVEPPAEVQRLAESINDLAEALAVSEGRQREFLLSVSHELRTPLTTIRGYAEALSDGVVEPDMLQATGRTVLAESERLERLVADLLSLARLEAADFPIEPSEVELSDLLRSAEQAFRPRWDFLSLELPDGPVWTHTDPLRLRQVIDGLVDNALRVLRPGDPLVLALRVQPGRVARAAEPPSGVHDIVVEVRDGGPGLTDGDIAVAFEKGALHQRYQGMRKVGSGLGLALAAGLVRRLGGVIEAGHAPEGGVRFTVYLPRTLD